MMILFLGALGGLECASATVKVLGFPSRQQVILVQRVVLLEAPSPLPPPSAPGLGEGAQDSVPLPQGVDIEKSAPLKAPLSPAELSKKARIESEKGRLNHNALLWQLDRAQAGSGSAMRSIGMRYMTGDGLEKDATKGREWLQKGADAGDAGAKKILGKMDEKNLEKNKP